MVVRRPEVYRLCEDSDDDSDQGGGFEEDGARASAHRGDDEGGLAVVARWLLGFLGLVGIIVTAGIVDAVARSLGVQAETLIVVLVPGSLGLGVLAVSVQEARRVQPRAAAQRAAEASWSGGSRKRLVWRRQRWWLRKAKQLERRREQAVREHAGYSLFQELNRQIAQDEAKAKARTEAAAAAATPSITEVSGSGRGWKVRWAHLDNDEPEEEVSPRHWPNVEGRCATVEAPADDEVAADSG